MEGNLFKLYEKIKSKGDKMNILEVGERIAMTDLTDCIMNAFGADSIEDKKLAGLWVKAKNAINEVDNYLKSKIGDDYEWGEFEVKGEKEKIK